MSKELFYVVNIKDVLDQDDLDEIIRIAKEDYHSAGYEEFSLNEEEVDEILGNDAFCGGDLTDELMERLEKEAAKTFKLFFTGLKARENAEGYLNFLKEAGAKNIFLEEKAVEDWNESWKKHYRPIDLGRFVILPVWDADIEIESKKEKIIINPGMGFGTGTHETTRQCLLSLLEEISEGETFDNCLDFGSGSGILGIGFQKICNGDVDYVDIDSRALDNNKDNLNLNFPNKPLNSGFYLREEFKLEKKYDLVFANILEHVLILEFDLLKDSVKPGKILIVSGLLKEQKENILKKYNSEFELKGEKCEGDWLALTFRKK